MFFASVIVFAVLSRAELIDRFRAPQIVQVDGLVQVRAECGAEMRREYQLPIAGFAAGVCRKLYLSDNLKERHFEQPGIVIVFGDVVTNVTNVVSRAERREDGTRYMKIMMPSPGYADRTALSLAITKGYSLAVHGVELDDDSAIARLRESDPKLKLADDYRALEEWYAGKPGTRDEEALLRLQRSVLDPGSASHHDVRIFASRLFLYPEHFDQPYCGRFDCLSFREAIPLAKVDPRIRFSAYSKIQEMVLYSGGRGAKMSLAGVAYADFLRDLLAYRKSESELRAELDAADALLKGVLE